VSVFSKENIKALGIFSDCDLKWGSLINKITSKCRTLLFSLKYLRNYRSLRELVRVIKCQVTPTIIYAAPIWSGIIGFQLRARIRSAFYFLICFVLWDFNHSLNWSRMLWLTQFYHCFSVKCFEHLHILLFCKIVCRKHMVCVIIQGHRYSIYEIA